MSVPACEYGSDSHQLSKTGAAGQGNAHELESRSAGTGAVDTKKSPWIFQGDEMDVDSLPWSLISDGRERQGGNSTCGDRGQPA